jgi:hypothetical protein
VAFETREYVLCFPPYLSVTHIPRIVPSSVHNGAGYERLFINRNLLCTEGPLVKLALSVDRSRLAITSVPDSLAEVVHVMPEDGVAGK